MNNEIDQNHQQQLPNQLQVGDGASAGLNRETLSLPTQHACTSPHPTSATDQLSTHQPSSISQSISSSNPNSVSRPPPSNGDHQSTTTLSSLPSQQSPSPALPQSQPVSASASIGAVPIAVTSVPPSQPHPALPTSSATSSINGNGASVPPATLDAPPSSAIPEHQSAVLSPLKVEGQQGSKVEGQQGSSGKPEIISVGSDSKVEQAGEMPSTGFAGGLNGNGIANGSGNENANGVAIGSGPVSTEDSGFVDGPSMVSGAPGTVDAAAQSVSQERLTEGEHPLPASVSPSLVPTQTQTQVPAASASPAPAPLPSPAAPAAPTNESQVSSSVPPQTQQHQPDPSLAVPSPVPESASSHLSSAPPAQHPIHSPVQAPATSAEDVKMADGTIAPAPTPAVTRPTSLPEASQPQTSMQPGEVKMESAQASSASVSESQLQQQQSDTLNTVPATESSSFSQEQIQQPNTQNDSTPAPLAPNAAAQAPPTDSSFPSQQAQAAAQNLATQPPQAAPAAPLADSLPQDPESSLKRQRPEEEGAVDAFGTPIIEMTAAQIKFAQNSIKSLKSRPEAPAFLQPVDPIALGIPQYRNFITHPADLGSIDIKLALTSAASKAQASGGADVKPTEKIKLAPQFGLDPKRDVYQNAQLWEEEVRRVFSNCKKFNGPEHPLSKGCDAMEKTFDKQMSSFPSARPQDSSSAVAADDSPTDKKIRRPSNPVPTIRRSSDDAGGRPKREIHPPPPKDMPYWDEPASGVSNRGGSGGAKRKAKTSAANSVAERAYYEKANKDELRFCEKVVQELYGPKHQAVAWVFYDLVDRNLDFAPAYYASIRHPISLREIQSKLRSGDYESRRNFDSDMQLLFRNCFTFNPPGTDVHTMGQKVKQAYEGRMRSIPKAAPFVAQPESGDDSYMDDGEDGDDSSDALMAAQIRQQIESLQANLAQLEGSKNKNPKAIANTKASLASMQSSAMTKPARSRPAPAPSALLAGVPAAPPAAPRNKPGRKPNGEQKEKKANGEKKKSAGGTKRKNSSSIGGAGGKRKSNGAGSDEDVRAVSYEQKEELASKITELPDDKLDGALRIIAEDKPQSATEEEEIELDIDDLSPKTLYKLYRYVCQPKRAKTGGGGSGGQKKKSSTNKGGHKNRVLDEDAEARRIASLQTQLNQFSGAPQASAAGPSGAHDDMVDSGSSGSESDSDSDDDAY